MVWQEWKHDEFKGRVSIQVVESLRKALERRFEAKTVAGQEIEIWGIISGEVITEVLRMEDDLRKVVSSETARIHP